VADARYPLRLPTRLPVLWRMTVLSLSLGVLMARLWDFAQGRPFSGVPTLAVTAMAVPMVASMYLLMAGRAGERGMRLFDGWGWPRQVAWDDIVDVQLRRWPALVFAPALAIRSRQGRVYWLPRESAGLGELHALVQRAAGPDHPLARALQTPLHRL
jgi:hypothetical protein